MKQAGMFLALLLLAGCGKSGGESDPFVDSIAETLQADCQRFAPVDPEAARKHQQLCACTTEKIRASGLKAGDGDKANSDKIHAAQQACRRQVYGNDA